MMCQNNKIPRGYSDMPYSCEGPDIVEALAEGAEIEEEISICWAWICLLINSEVCIWSVNFIDEDLLASSIATIVVLFVAWV